MTALEEIEAAIEKLTKLRDAAPGAPWGVEYAFDEEPVLRGSDLLGKRFSNEFATLDNVAAGKLIVTLHATVDAQLSLLEAAMFNIRADGLGYTRATVSAAVRLAKSINGGTE